MAVIDEDALRQRYGGRDAMIDRLSNTFLRTHSDTASKIREAVTAEDFDSLMNTAHTLKGLSGFLEANELYALAEHAQLTTQLHDPRALKQCQEMADALDRVIDKLTERVS